MLYVGLEEEYDSYPDHDIETVILYFNAKIHRGNIFKPTIGNFSLQTNSSNNEHLKNTVFNGTIFQHKYIHKSNWISTDKRIKNQFNRLVIEGTHLAIRSTGEHQIGSPT